MKNFTRRNFLKIAGLGAAFLGTGGIHAFAAEAGRRLVKVPTAR